MRIGKIEWNYSLKMQYRNWIRRLYFSHSLTLFLYIAITGSLSLSLRHSIFYEIFHSISASCANFIFPLFGNINYEIIHLCCNLHTIPACPIYASWLCSSCHCLTTVLILCRTNTHTHPLNIARKWKMSTIRFYSLGLSCAFISLTSCVRAIWRPTRTWCECQWFKSGSRHRCHHR